MARHALAVVMLIVAVAVQTGAGAQRQSSGSSAVAKRFIGTWRLVSIEGGPANPNRGGRPTGYIYYDTTGHMAVQIMPDRARPKYTGAPTPEQAKETLMGYTAYFGTFTVDEQKQTVTHHREGTLTPGVVDFVRKYELSGNRLTLTPVDSGTHLTWELVK